MSNAALAEIVQTANDLGAALVYDATGWHLDFDPAIKVRVESLLADHDAPATPGGGSRSWRMSPTSVRRDLARLNREWRLQQGYAP